MASLAPALSTHVLQPSRLKNAGQKKHWPLTETCGSRGRFNRSGRGTSVGVLIANASQYR